MKKPTKILIGVIVAVVIIAGAVFATNTDLFKGSLREIKNITKGQLAELIVTTLSPVIDPDVISNLSQECATDTYSAIGGTSICYLVSKGILSISSSDGSVKPNNSVSRAEGVVIFNKVLTISSVCFSDG